MQTIYFLTYLVYLIKISTEQTLDDFVRQTIGEAINETPQTSGIPSFRSFVPNQRPGVVRAVNQRNGAARSSTRLANLFNGQRPVSQRNIQTATGGIVTEKTLRKLQNSTFRGRPVSFRDVQAPIAAAVKQLCGEKPITCNMNAPYRNPDGSCNNLFRVQMGMADTPQSRFLVPEYDDPWNWGFVPRIRGKSGNLLASPRDISNAVFKSATSSPKDNRFNVALTHFGQFIDHDVVKTPIFAGDYDNAELECCDDNNHVIRPECFPFTSPPGDFKYTCMNFVRSRPACVSGRREQVNIITSWLDLSNVYGSSKEELESLRQNSNGLLKVGKDNLLPDDIGTCADGDRCFKAGDTRNSEIPLLTVMHIIFVREHNRIAHKLSTKGWTDEKVFQETRKILTGIYQHIVFNEFLPAVLGFQWSQNIGLLSKPNGLINHYSSSIDGSTRNEFGAAAFRMGHSLVGNSVGASNSIFNEIRKTPLKDEFFSTETIRHDFDYGVQKIGRWMSANFARKCDRFFSNQLRNHLFEIDAGEALDLGALNIQRGRDHGIPGYNKFREFCGLYPAAFFSNSPGGFIDHSSDAVSQMASVYKHPDDVDLYVGAISERPESTESILGPTFRCMVALQFLHYKYADRFFYENNYPTTGFNFAQVNDIKRQSLAGIYCRTLKLSEIQPDIFINPLNPADRIPCGSLPDLDFSLY